MQKEILIRKANGDLEPFSQQKLKNSLLRVKASPQLADEIVAKVNKDIKNGDSTMFVYSYALSLLRDTEKSAAGRYSLKRAIMELGPSGHPFERIVSELLRLEGFESVKTAQIVPGFCVDHEVDVLAEKGKERVFVECKFHNQFGVKTDLKVSLYVKARFDDIEKDIKRQNNISDEGKTNTMWLVTNTKLTTEAIKYAQCSGVVAIGWNYPKGNGLEARIDKAGFHPLTSLSTLSQAQKKNLLNQGFALCKDVFENQDSLRAVGIAGKKMDEVKKEISLVCGIE